MGYRLNLWKSIFILALVVGTVGLECLAEQPGQRRPDHQQIIQDGGQTIINNYYYGNPPAQPQIPPAPPTRPFDCSGVCHYTVTSSVVGSYSYIPPATRRVEKTVNSTTSASSPGQAESRASGDLRSKCSRVCNQVLSSGSSYVRLSNSGCQVSSIQCR